MGAYLLIEGSLTYERQMIDVFQSDISLGPNLTRGSTRTGHLNSILSSPGDYTDHYSDERQRLEAGDWISNAAIWLNWQYRGTLSAARNSEMLAIHVQHLCLVLRRHPDLHAMNCSYALAFAKLVM